MFFRTNIRHIYSIPTFLAVFAIFVTGTNLSCNKGKPTVHGPSFPQEVIDAGRNARYPSTAGSRVWGYSVSTESLKTAPEPTPAPTPVPEIPATKEAILLAFNNAIYAQSPRERGSGFDSVRTLDLDALKPLLELLKDEQLPCNMVNSVVNALIRLGREDRKVHEFHRLPTTPVIDRPLNAHANRIVNAIVVYASKNPHQHISVSGLSKILPLDRVPEVIDWAESSSGERQRSYIILFCELTHTSFPTIRHGFCGNSVPVPICKEEEKQKKSPKLMREWWAVNGQKPYHEWVFAQVERNIKREQESREWSLKQYPDDPRMQAVYTRELPGKNTLTLIPDVFKPLCRKLEQSPGIIQPYILGLIGRCDHPDRIKVVSCYLNNPDDNIKSVAIELLGELNATKYTSDIRKILANTTDLYLPEKAINALSAFNDSQAFEPIVNQLASSDFRITNAAKDAIRKFLPTNTPLAKRLARKHKEPTVRNRLAQTLNEWEANQKVNEASNPAISRADKIERAAKLLQSSDVDSQKSGITLICRHNLAELIPLCLEILPDANQTVSEDLVNIITGYGVPGLNPNNASNYLGHSLKLDQQIALYCYARYGDAALPLVRKVAFQWRDPISKHEDNVGSPNSKLLKILSDRNDPGFDDKLNEMVIAIPENRISEYSGLLELLSSTAPTESIDRLLAHDSYWYRNYAERLIWHVGLKQYDERMSEVAMNSLHPNRAAVEALIDFEHPSAWSAAVRLLNSNTLNSRAGIGVPGPFVAYYLGLNMASLKHSHRDDMYKMLQAELAGPMRRRVVVALTASIAFEPDELDRDILLSIAGQEDAPRAAQILAAVAISRMNDKACIPHLKRLLRDCLQTDCTGKHIECDPVEFFDNHRYDDNPTRARIYPKEAFLQETRKKEHRRGFIRSSRELSDMVSALHHWEPDALVPEVVDALVSPDGTWNQVAYMLLLQMKGMEGYRLARKKVSETSPEMVDHWTITPRIFVNMELSHDDALSLLTYEKLNLIYESLLIIKHDLREACDPLVDLFAECRDKHTPYSATILDILCRFGDKRGLDLALDDPLLFMESATYLAEPPVPVPEIRIGGFKYNRIQDSLAIIKWYKQNRNNLVWDNTIKRFTLASGS